MLAASLWDHAISLLHRRTGYDPKAVIGEVRFCDVCSSNLRLLEQPERIAQGYLPISKGAQIAACGAALSRVDPLDSGRIVIVAGEANTDVTNNAAALNALPLLRPPRLPR
jgi:hypothetical protein